MVAVDRPMPRHRSRVPAAWIAPPWWVGMIVVISMAFVPLGMLVHEDFLLAFLAGVVVAKTSQAIVRR
jgi:hypothetical protein